MPTCICLKQQFWGYVKKSGRKRCVVLMALNKYNVVSGGSGGKEYY